MPGLKYPGAAIFPGIDHQFVVKPEAYPVVDLYLKEISRALEVESASPASREIISRDLRGRSILIPIMIDFFFIPNQNRVALKMAVVEILGFPFVEAIDPLPIHLHGSIVPALIIL